MVYFVRETGSLRASRPADWGWLKQLCGKRFRTSSIGACFMTLLSYDDTYDFATGYEEHKTLTEVFRKGGPEEARQVFEGMVEIFRVQDVKILRALDAEGKVERSHPRALVEA